jgi:hypothetical protein
MDFVCISTHSRRPPILLMLLMLCTHYCCILLLPSDAALADARVCVVNADIATTTASDTTLSLDVPVHRCVLAVRWYVAQAETVTSVTLTAVTDVVHDGLLLSCKCLVCCACKILQYCNTFVACFHATVLLHNAQGFSISFRVH